MSIQITHVRFSGQEKTHQSIVSYAWKNTVSGKTGSSDKPAMVEYIDGKKGVVEVGSGANRVRVGVVRPDGGKPYLRTYADEKWSNNLLSLPTF
ncbi:DUF3892 domain-containing protein [Microbacterium foliorum]